MAQLVKRPTLGFVSGHDLTVREFESRIRLTAVSAEPAWDSIPLSLSLSLSQNNNFFKKPKIYLFCTPSKPQ